MITIQGSVRSEHPRVESVHRVPSTDPRLASGADLLVVLRLSMPEGRTLITQLERQMQAIEARKLKAVDVDDFPKP